MAGVWFQAGSSRKVRKVHQILQSETLELNELVGRRNMYGLMFVRIELEENIAMAATGK